MENQWFSQETVLAHLYVSLPYYIYRVIEYHQAYARLDFMGIEREYFTKYIYNIMYIYNYHYINNNHVEYL